MDPMPSSSPEAEAPVQAPPRKVPTKGSKIAFWLGVVLWVCFCALMSQVTPILDALKPSLQVGLAFNLAVSFIAVAAANFVAIYPAFIRRELRSNPINILVWLVAIVAAVLGDLACLWGVVKLVLYGPSIY